MQIVDVQCMQWAGLFPATPPKAARLHLRNNESAQLSFIRMSSASTSLHRCALKCSVSFRSDLDRAPAIEVVDRLVGANSPVR
eukprot:2388940-Rhodomonas_salina.1